jgi:hypothetical protein
MKDRQSIHLAAIAAFLCLIAGCTATINCGTWAFSGTPVSASSPGAFAAGSSFPNFPLRARIDEDQLLASVDQIEVTPQTRSMIVSLLPAIDANLPKLGLGRSVGANEQTRAHDSVPGVSARNRSIRGIDRYNASHPGKI